MKQLNGLFARQARRLLLALAILCAFGAGSVFGARSTLLSENQSNRSVYVDQLESSVRGLSPQEVDDLLNGRGAGYARTAELNSHPGPRHVLDLQDELQLTPEQVQSIDETYRRVNAEARRIGRLIVAGEQRLSDAFAEGRLSEEALTSQVAQLASLYGQLRAIHLKAHLEITPLLSPEQVAAYDQLRGYATAGSSQEQHPHSGH